MSDVWNLWETKPPPVCTIKTLLNLEEVNNLKSIVYDVLQTLQNFKYLNKEAALLSRFLYKFKRTFRHDKGTQILVKIYQCLKRYLKLNFKETVDSFYNTFPEKLSSLSTHAYLPTQQMLKWVLLRLQAFSQIFNRLILLSKQAGIFFHGKISLGWTSYINLIAYCMVARFSVASKFILIKSIEWYNSLYKCQPLLKSTAKFLQNHEFPKDLKSWIGDVDISFSKSERSIDKIFEMIDLGRKAKENEDEDEHEEEENEVSFVVDKPKKPTLKSDIKETIPDVEEKNVGIQKNLKRNVSNLLKEQDLGTLVEDERRDEEIPAKKFKKKQKKKHKNKYLHKQN